MPPCQPSLDLVWARLRRKTDGALERILRGPRWKGKALAAILALTLLRAFPSYDALDWPYVQATWRNVQPLLEHPLADPARLPAASQDPRLRNLTFRLTVPLLARLLHLRRNGLLLVFAAAGIALLHATLRVVKEVTSSRKTAFCVCLAVACAWPGEAAFHDLRGGYFDAVALCLLVIALASPSASVAALCVYLAAWTDERALPASAFVLLFALSRAPAAGWRNLTSGKPAAVPAAWAAYLASRAFLASAHSLATTTGGVGLTAFVQQFNALPLGIWTGLGGCWILIACGMLSGLLQRRYRITACFCGMLGLLVMLAVSITDITRTMAYCLPAVFLALSLLARGESVRQVEKLALLSSVVSFATPTYYVQGSTGFWWLYPLPVHLVRWFSG
jgi:hypothetical protein